MIIIRKNQLVGREIDIFTIIQGIIIIFVHTIFLPPTTKVWVAEVRPDASPEVSTMAVRASAESAHTVSRTAETFICALGVAV